MKARRLCKYYCNALRAGGLAGPLCAHCDCAEGLIQMWGRVLARGGALALALVLGACGGELEPPPRCAVIAQVTLREGACEAEATARCELPDGWVRYRVSAQQEGEWHHFDCEPLPPGAVEDIASCSTAARAKVELCR